MTTKEAVLNAHGAGADVFPAGEVFAVEKWGPGGGEILGLWLWLGLGVLGYWMVSAGRRSRSGIEIGRLPPWDWRSYVKLELSI